MRCDIEKRGMLALTVDIDQIFADTFKQTDCRELVIYQNAIAARG